MAEKGGDLQQIVMAGSMQQCTNPEVEVWGAKLDGKAFQEPRQNYVMKEARRNKRREKMHAKALQEWELANPKHKHPMVPLLARVS